MLNYSIKPYIKDLLNIALPIVIGNIGFILIGVGDVLVAGRHSTDTLAAISIATAITNCIQIFGIGLLVSVSPLLSNYRGANSSAKKYFYPTLRFAMFISFLIMLVILAAIPVIDYLNFEPKLVPMIKQYMFITAFATFGGYLHAAIREFLQAFEIVLFPNILTLFAVVLNLCLNIVLVFGFWIIPSLGVAGLAIASFIVRYFMGLTLLIYCYKIMSFKNYAEFDYYKQLIKIGIPISTAILIEFVAFNSVALIMGRVSGVYAAAQNLVCTLTNASFMVPLAISNAIAVKVGFANGARDYVNLKRFALIGTAMCIFVMIFSSLIFLSIPEVLVKIFTKDPILIKICIPVILILACFQIFDGLQVALSGIFKGIKKTKIVLLGNFVAYWLISIPLGLFLAFKGNMGLVGFWVSLLISSIILGILLLSMLNKYFKKFNLSNQ